MKKQNNTISKFSVIWIFLMIHSLSFATGKTYPSCKPKDYFPKKGEDFCPQLEGVTLPYCCPQPSLPALTCTYYKAKTMYSAQVRKNCYGGGAALVVSSVSCVDSVQQDLVSTKLVYRGSSGSNGGSCCVQTCPPTRVLNGETLSLQTAQSPVSCDSLTGYSQTEQSAKESACRSESDQTACLAYSSVCAEPPPVVTTPSDPPPVVTTPSDPPPVVTTPSDPPPGNPLGSPGPLPPTDPGGTPSPPVVTDRSPTPPQRPIVTPPAYVAPKRDSL